MDTSVVIGASGGNPAASPTAVGSRSRPLAGPIQAGFDHGLLDSVVSPPFSVGSTRSLFDSSQSCLSTVAPYGFDSRTIN